MAWPPPVLPTNRTNTTVMATTHPADHNTANQAINDIVVNMPRLRAWATAGTGGNFGPGTFHVLGAGAITTVAGRLYRITIAWDHTVQTGAGQMQVQIWRNGGGTQLAQTLRSLGAGTSPGGSLSVIDNPGAGSFNYHFSQFSNATNAQIMSYMAVMVEEMGPYPPAP